MRGQEHGNQFSEKLEEFLTTEDTELHGGEEEGEEEVASLKGASCLATPKPGAHGNVRV